MGSKDGKDGDSGLLWGERSLLCCCFFFFIFYHATELAVQRSQGVKPGLSIHRQDPVLRGDDLKQRHGCRHDQGQVLSCISLLPCLSPNSYPAW